jgi:hypothetical protein
VPRFVGEKDGKTNVKRMFKQGKTRKTSSYHGKDDFANPRGKRRLLDPIIREESDYEMRAPFTC